MTHMGPMRDDEGKFSEPECTQSGCRKCEEETVIVQAWDSNDGAYTDYRYQCTNCGHVWWIEGPDA